MILGGFTRESDDKQVSGVPILMDIPLLGALFRSTSNTKKRSVLYLFVQPKILRDPNFEDLLRETDGRKEGAKKTAEEQKTFDGWILDDEPKKVPVPAPKE